MKKPKLPSVRQQYEDRPYPHRRPRDERKRLLATTMGHLTLVNHIFWSGGRGYDESFRVLDAGCGTGDATVYIAEQLRKTPARVTAIDLSEASLKVTRQRLAARGLDNVDLIQAPIEDLPTLGLGPFDYIHCSGVLHHLPSPEAGLDALRGVLKPDGGMGIMVYGLYGRVAVYQMQELFRLIAPAAWRDTKRISVVKKTLDGLREKTWAAFRSALWEDVVRREGDAGYMDMFLHAQDRAYTVPQIHAWLDAAQMALVRFHQQRYYEPDTLDLGVAVGHLAEREQQAVAELLDGRMAMHTFFASQADYAPPAPPAWDDERAIPVWTASGAVVKDLKQTGKATVTTHIGSVTAEVTGATLVMLNAFDGKTPLLDGLQAASQAFPRASATQILDAWKQTYRLLGDVNVLALNWPA